MADNWGEETVTAGQGVEETEMPAAITVADTAGDEIKLFGKWSTVGINVSDMALTVRSFNRLLFFYSECI